MIKTTKSIKELENLWSIQSLKQSLRRYKFVPLDDRYIKWNKKQPVYLQLKGIQQDQVNPTELADEIAKKSAKEDQITINGTKLAWHQLIKDNIHKQEQRTGGFYDSITNKKTTEATGSSPFVVTINKENTKNVNIKAIQDNIMTMDTITNEHNRNIIDNNTIEKDTEVDKMIMDDNILMDTIADQIVRMSIEDVGTMKHKDIMNTQTINVKITNIDTTEQQDQIKYHYIGKRGLDNNTHNINNITNKDSVMDVTDLINQDMDVDSQIVSGEENEEREIRYRNNKNNHNTNKKIEKIDNKNNPKKYNKKLEKNRKEKSKTYNKTNEKVSTKEKMKKEISTLNICTFNARGINDTKKQELISQLVQTEEWDIANINKTKLMTRKGEFAFNNIKKEFRSIVNSTNDTNSKGGQITLIKDKLDYHAINIEFVQGYCTKLDLIFKKNSKQKNILLIMVYIPNDDKKIKDSIIQQSKTWIENAYRKEQDIIVMGDFNESDKNKDKDNKFVRMLKKSELIDVHKFFFENDVRTTWSNGNTSSRIDYIFSTENLMNNIIQHEVIQGVQIKTDHNIMTFKISINDIIIKNNRFLKKDSIVSDIEKLLKSKYTNTRNFTDEDWEFLAVKLESDVNESIEFLLDDQQNKNTAWEFIVNSFQTNKNKLIEGKIKEKRMRTTDTIEEEEQYILDYNNKRNNVIILKKMVKIIEITKKRINSRKVKKQVQDKNISDQGCTIKKNHVIIKNWNCKGVGKRMNILLKQYNKSKRQGKVTMENVKSAGFELILMEKIKRQVIETWKTI
ncbi:unnamed protein product [Rhizophagus irregularis]|nr:unnamed protein product [Rhizophagus irregularis]